MTNEYHDEIGRFCSRDRMRQALKESLNAGNVNVYLRLKEDLVKADKSSNYLPSKKYGLVHPSLKTAESDIIARDQLIENGSAEEIEQWVENRIYSDSFSDLLEDRDAMKERSRQLIKEYKDLNERFEKGNLKNFEIVRKKGFEAQEAYEEFMVLKNQSNEYKDITAPAVAKLSELVIEDRTEKGIFKEYTEDTLNDLVATGEFPSGSREWLEQRQNGIGGSDVGKIIGVNDDTGLNRSDYLETLTSKLDPISEEQVEEQAAGHSVYSGYAGRGNAWEESIAQKFGDNNPDLNITHCKTSWQNKNNPYQFANFDGLMADENGVPNGILEIKTASDASKWGDTSLGLDGVPKQYRAQTLWYADAAGFNKGAIAVMIDDREYREYHFTVTPELRAEMESNRQKVAQFVQDVQDIKDGKKVDPRTPRNISGREMFSPSLLTSARRGHDASFKEASILREETIEQTRTRFNEIIGDAKDETSMRDAMYKLYSEKAPADRKSNFIHIDLETSNTTPTTGHIIEIGVSVRGPQGGEIEKQSKLYGLSRRALKATNTGMVNVHGITEGKIAKKRTFRHPEEQKKLLKTLKSGIMVSHNASFERRWLRQHLDGFAKAEARGEIRVIDTKNLTQRLLTKTPNATLQSFCEEQGIPYENAHRAYNDAAMMGEGLDKFLDSLHKGDLKN